jgi:hypothetical protein
MNWPGYRPKSRRSRQLAEGAVAHDRLRFLRGDVIRRGIGASLLVLTPPLSGYSADKSSGNLIYHPSTGFQIPFEIDPADKPFLKVIELYVSSDLGKSWQLSTGAKPNSKSFKFRAKSDGEYWFAVRTLDVEGRYNPADDKPIVPDWRVVVDSQKPGLGVRSIARRGTTATIAWDARDENLDMGTFVLEYSIPGTGEWKPVPIARPVPNGESTWDCGTSESIRVRATVADRAGNVQIAETQLADGVAQHPNLDSSRPSDMESQGPPPIARMASAAGDRRGILGPQDPLTNRTAQDNEWVETPRAYGPESMTPATRGSESGRMPKSTQPPGGQYQSAERNDQAPKRSTPILNSPRFPMNYVVDDAGPNGPASVELWVTRDGGKNWSRWSEDEDRVSPMMVDLGGEGVFGLSIVARSIAGQGDETPRSGSLPQITVEIDATPPAMILNVIKVGVGSQSGKVLISWQAEDRNFGHRPISIYYRPETATQWMPIVENIENTGQYVWTPGPQVPPVFHVKIEARDQAGNRSSVDTTQYDPVLLDRSRPKGRILGINVNPIDTTTPNVQQPAQPQTRSNESNAQPVNPGGGIPNASNPAASNPGVKPSGRIAPFPANIDEPAPSADPPVQASATEAQPAQERSNAPAPPVTSAAPALADKPVAPIAQPEAPVSQPANQAAELPPGLPELETPKQPSANTETTQREKQDTATAPATSGLQSIPPTMAGSPAIEPPIAGADQANPGLTGSPAIRPPGLPEATQIPDPSSTKSGDGPSANEPEPARTDLSAPPPLPPSGARDPNEDVLPQSLELPLSSLFGTKNFAMAKRPGSR